MHTKEEVRGGYSMQAGLQVCTTMLSSTSNMAAMHGTEHDALVNQSNVAIINRAFMQTAAM
jgi:hypothetical protein